MFDRRGFSLVELFIVVAIVGTLAAVVIPAFASMRLRAQRAEVPANVDGIRTAEAAFHAAHGRWMEVPEFQPSSDVSSQPRPWPARSEFDILGWQPDGDVRGAYKVDVTGTEDFRVTGICDVDDDNLNAAWVGSRYGETRSTSRSSVY